MHIPEGDEILVLRPYLHPYVAAASSLIAKTWKQAKYPPLNQWIKKMWRVCVCVHRCAHINTRARAHAHTEYYSAIKKERLPFSTTRRSLEGTKLRDRSQILIQTLYDLTYMWKLNNGNPINSKPAKVGEVGDAGHKVHTSVTRRMIYRI